MHRLGCPGEGDGSCGGVAALCPEGMEIPPAIQPSRTSGDALYKRNAPYFYTSLVLDLKESVDSECTKISQIPVSGSPSPPEL